MPAIIIEIPGNPQGKGRPRFRTGTTKTGKKFAFAYTPIKTRRYEDAIRWQAKAAMRGQQPLEGPLIVHIDAFMEVPASWSRKKRDAALTGILYPVSKIDADNIGKAALDAGNKIIWRDDCQIVDLRIMKSFSDNPTLVIRVTPIESALTAVTGERATA